MPNCLQWGRIRSGKRSISGETLPRKRHRERLDASDSQRILTLCNDSLWKAILSMWNIECATKDGQWVRLHERGCTEPNERDEMKRFRYGQEAVRLSPLARQIKAFSRRSPRCFTLVVWTLAHSLSLHGYLRVTPALWRAPSLWSRTAPPAGRSCSRRSSRVPAKRASSA